MVRKIPLLLALAGLLAACDRPVVVYPAPQKTEIKSEAIEEDILEPPGEGQDAAPLIQSALQKRGIARLRDGGVFHLRSSVKIGSNQGLIGAATLVPDFDSTTNPGHNLAAITIQGKNVRLEGFYIRKPFVDGSYAIGMVINPGSENINLRGIEISGYSARYGILLVETTGFEITHCVIRDFMMNASGDMIEDSPAGICAKRCANGVVSNNRLTRIEVGPNGLASVSPLRPQYGKQGYQSDHMTIQQCRGISIVGNVMTTSGEGIDLLLSAECAVTGNVIRDMWFQGIKALGVSSSVISGNFISDCYQGIGLATHGAFNAECENNAVTGNVILNTGTPGTFGVSAMDRVKYNGTAAIDVHDTSRNNIIANNVIQNPDKRAVMLEAIRTNPNNRNNLIHDNLPPVPGTP